MKNLWNKHKKLIVGGIGAAMAAAIVIGQTANTELEAEAATGILSSMNDYLTNITSSTDANVKNKFTILEIVPETDDREYQEMGAFVKKNNDAQEPWDAMVSGYFNRFSNSGQWNWYRDAISSESVSRKERMDALLEMRLLGIVKKTGVTVGGHTTQQVDYPVYANWNGTQPIFTEGFTPNDLSEAVPDNKYTFAYGNYAQNVENKGAYKLEVGYILGDDGYIYYRGAAAVNPEGDTDAAAHYTIDDQDTDDDQNDQDNTDSNTDTSNDGSDQNTDDSSESVSANSFERTAAVGTEEVTLDDSLESGEPVQQQDVEPTVDERPVLDQSNDTFRNLGADAFNRNYSYYLNQFLPVMDTDTQVPTDWSLAYYRKGNTVSGKTLAYNPIPDGVIYCGDTMDGNLDFTPDENGRYWGFSQVTSYYITNQNAKFYNSDWFKAFVFGDRFSGINITVNTIKASDVEESDITSANLIYISGTSSAFYTAKADLKESAFMALYNNNVIGHKALIMDYDSCSGNPITSDSNNIDKLAALLWQADQKGVPAANSNYTKYFNINTGAISDVNALLKDASFFENMRASILTGVKGNFVTGNVYVYDHYRDLFKNSKSMVDAHDLFLNGDFASSYKESVYSEAFGSVYAYIQNNNSVHTDFAIADDVVTPALVIQYILSTNGDNVSFVKSSISVLEIQPTAAFKYNAYNMESDQYDFCKKAVQNNRDKFIHDYINPEWVEEGKQGYVSFDSMTVSEFVCRNENIGEKYDMIYIGSQFYSNINHSDSKKNIYYHNYMTDAKSWDIVNDKEVKYTITKYNDTAMTGMVYYNIGDLHVMNSDGGKYSNTPVEKIGVYLDTENEYSVKETRYSGIDLNTEKLEQLKVYLDAGHPIVVAGDLMCADKSGNSYCVNPTRRDVGNNTTKWDRGRIDNSSKMYELFQYALHHTYNGDTGKYVVEGTNMALNDSRISSNKYENFISESDVERNLTSWETIYGYLNTPKLYLDISAMPTAYTYELKTVKDKTNTNRTVINPETVTYLEPDEDGTTNLEYEFTISGVSASNTNYKYNIRLYVDVNSDGKYSNDEECDDAVVTEAATGREMDTDEDGRYQLEEGVAYKLKREVPSTYMGIIPWCLRAELSSDSRIQTNEIGYTCVKAKKKEVIKILQIMLYDNQNNLQNDILNEGKYNNRFGVFIENLADYDVKVISLPMKTFVQQYVDSGYKEDAMGFYNSYNFETKYPGAGKGVDMLLLGFGDAWPAKYVTDAYAQQSIRKFAETGRPVLLCHDFLMYSNTYSQAKNLRDVFGMDRYGVTSGLQQLKKGDGHGSYPWNDAATDADARWNKAGQEAERSGYQVAYMPDTERTVLSRATQGFSDAIQLRYPGGSNNALKGSYSPLANVNNIQGEWYIDQLNSGRLTEYPYHIAKSFQTSRSHAQYYQLNIESDADQDGNSDLSVWYVLSKNKDSKVRMSDSIFPTAFYSATPGDGINNYYIYNKGNVTYTGAGHGEITQEEEIKLFINTLLAAYTAAEQAPEVKFFETQYSTSNELKNVAIPYDSTVTKKLDDDGNATASVDSSIIYNKTKNDYEYKFVDPNVNDHVADKDKTAVYFRTTDSNFKKGIKHMSVTFWLEVKEAVGTNFIMSDNSTQVVQKRTIDGIDRNVVRLTIKMYDPADPNHEIPHEMFLNEDGSVKVASDLRSGKMYMMYLPLAYLNDKGVLSIYAESKTFFENKTTFGATIIEENPYVGYGKLDITKVDLLKLD